MEATSWEFPRESSDSINEKNARPVSTSNQQSDAIGSFTSTSNQQSYANGSYTSFITNITGLGMISNVVRSVISSLSSRTQSNVSHLRSMLADVSMSFRASFGTFNPDVLNLFTEIIGFPIADSRRLMNGLQLDSVASIIRLSRLEYETFIHLPGNHRLRSANYFEDILTFQNWMLIVDSEPCEYTMQIHANLKKQKMNRITTVINTRGPVSPTSTLRSRSKSPSPKSVQFEDEPFAPEESTIPQEDAETPVGTDDKPESTGESKIDSDGSVRMANLNKRIAELEGYDSKTPSSSDGSSRSRTRSGSRSRSRSSSRRSRSRSRRRGRSSSSDSRGDTDSSDSDSDSDDSTSEEEDEERYSSQKFRPFKLEPYQTASTKLPMAPVTYTKLKAWINPVHNQFEAHGLSRLITKDKSKRALKPVWPKNAKRSQKNRKYRNHRKDLRAWERDSKNLKLALLEMSLNHYLLESIREYNDGVAAYDFILESIDPGEINAENELAQKLKLISGLSLNSLSAGSFSKFHARFETSLAEATTLGALPYPDPLKKALLIGKLDHPEYDPMKLPSATDTYEYKEYVLNLHKFASMREVSNKNGEPTFRTKRIINATKIGGYEVNEKGIIPRETWLNLTREEQKKFMTARKKHFGISDDNPSSKESIEREKSKDRKIKQLQAQVKTLSNIDTSDSPNSDSASKETQPSKVTIDKSYADAIKGANKQAKALAMKILKDNSSKKVTFKVKNTRTIRVDTRLIQNNTSTRTDLVATIDGGADTSFHGKGFTFIEYGERKANVIGCNDDVQNNLNIGTSITAVKDIDGNTVILLTNEAIENKKSNSMFSSNQLRHFGIHVDDTPRLFGGQQWMKLGEDCIIPFSYNEGLLTLDVREPTEEDLKHSPIYCVTSDDIWNPTTMSDKHNPDVASPIGWDLYKNTRMDKRTTNETFRELVAKRLNRNYVYALQNDVTHAFEQRSYSKDQDDNKLDDLFDSDESSDEELIHPKRTPFGATNFFANIVNSSPNDDDASWPSDEEIQDLVWDSEDNDSSSEYEFSDDENSVSSMPALIQRDDDSDSSDDESDDENDEINYPQLISKNTASVYSNVDNSSTFCNSSPLFEQGDENLSEEKDDDSVEIILDKFKNHRRARKNERRSSSNINENPNSKNSDDQAKKDGSCEDKAKINRKKWKVNGNDMTHWIMENMSHNIEHESKYGPSVSAAHTGEVLNFVNQCSCINNLNMRNKPKAKFTIDWDRARRCLGYFPLDVIKKTF